MKKSAKLVLAAAIGASVCVCAWGQESQEVAAQSANAVGVVKYTIPPEGGFALISLPMNPLDGTNWVWGQTSLAAQLDRGSIVYFWDKETLSWANFPKKTINGKWADEAANWELAPGEAIFVRSSPTNYEPKVISLLGELPVESELTYDLQGGNQFDLHGLTMYPVDGVFGDSELATALPKGSTIHFWDTNSASWASYSRKLIGSGAWPAEVLERSWKVGEGVFIQSKGTSVSTVTNERPFNWD